MIATPSASSTTPTSSGSAFADGPVVIGDTVLAGDRLDVHLFMLRIELTAVNIH
jgi:hypothetical protein